MSDQTGAGSGHIDPVSQRRARLEGHSANPVVRVLTGAILLVAFAAVAVLILAPGEVKRLFTAGASESEDMQEPSTPASDLMFEPTKEPVEVVTTDPTVVLPPAEDDADPDRIAALEREIEALRAANGQNAEELRALLPSRRRRCRSSSTASARAWRSATSASCRTPCRRVRSPRASGTWARARRRPKRGGGSRRNAPAGRSSARRRSCPTASCSTPGAPSPGRKALAAAVLAAS